MSGVFKNLTALYARWYLCWGNITEIKMPRSNLPQYVAETIDFPYKFAGIHIALLKIKKDIRT